MTQANRCPVCSKDPSRRVNDFAECSHVDCPYRRTAWSERPKPADLYRGPWEKNEDKDPEELK